MPPLDFSRIRHGYKWLLIWLFMCNAVHSTMQASRHEELPVTGGTALIVASYYVVYTLFVSMLAGKTNTVNTRQMCWWYWEKFIRDRDICILSFRLRWAVRFTVRPLYLLGKNAPVPFDLRLCEPLLHYNKPSIRNFPWNFTVIHALKYPFLLNESGYSLRCWQEPEADCYLKSLKPVHRRIQRFVLYQLLA